MGFETCNDTRELAWWYIGAVQYYIDSYQGKSIFTEFGDPKMSAAKAMKHIVEVNAEFEKRLDELSVL